MPGLPLLASLYGASDLMYAVTGPWQATLLLISPYAALAWLAPQARPKVGCGASALLLVGSGLFFVSASSDAQGGLVILYILSLQWVVAALAGYRRFSVPPEGAQPPAKY